MIAVRAAVVDGPVHRLRVREYTGNAAENEEEERKTEQSSSEHSARGAPWLRLIEAIVTSGPCGGKVEVDPRQQVSAALRLSKLAS